MNERVTPVAKLLLVSLNLREPAQFRFFHGPTLYAFLHARLGTHRSESFPKGVRLCPLESGRIRYAAGDRYHFALALLPDATIELRLLLERLRSGGQERSLQGASLGPRTEVAHVTDLVSGRLVTQRDAAPLSLRSVERNAAVLAEAAV